MVPFMTLAQLPYKNISRKMQKTLIGPLRAKTALPAVPQCTVVRGGETNPKSYTLRYFYTNHGLKYGPGQSSF